MTERFNLYCSWCVVPLSLGRILVKGHYLDEKQTCLTGMGTTAHTTLRSNITKCEPYSLSLFLSCNVSAAATATCKR